MLKIKADTLDAAYTRAALEFGCSVTELDVQVISEGGGGFLGIFKKPAIIVADRKNAAAKKDREPIEREPRLKYEERQARQESRQETRQEPRQESKQESRQETRSETRQEIDEEDPPIKIKYDPKYETKIEQKTETKKEEEKRDRFEKPTLRPSAADRLIHGAFSDNEPAKEFRREMAKEFDKEQVSRQTLRAVNIPFEENKYEHTREIKSFLPRTEEEALVVCGEVRGILRSLFDNTGYRIDTIEVTLFDDKTLKIFFNGEDAALLIGKDGYRYKALSYILFNWVNPTYGYLLRLEIAEFLQNQEDMILRYLEPIIDQIKNTGKGQTRVLDGVLVQIALKELRTRFPDKYVGIKTSQDGEGKYVVVNDFVRRYGG